MTFGARVPMVDARERVTGALEYVQLSADLAAERVVEDAEKGRVDLGDLGRRARRLLESTSKKETEPLF